MYDLEKARKLIKLASEEADLSPAEEYEFYKKAALRTKEELLTEIRLTQQNYPQTHKNKRSAEFYRRLDVLFNSFCEEIESHVIMEPLDNFWGYSFGVDETGISLQLEHFMVSYDFVEKEYPDYWKWSSTHYLSADDQYTLIEIKANLLTLEEYGKAYGVEAGTVRQWIRRGKLRSAFKFGNDWRVPELADQPTRGYTDAMYYWKTDLPNPPVEIPDINSADSINIYKNTQTGEWTAALMCFEKMGDDKEIVLDIKTKEKLELYLISHPLVRCANNYILEVHQKKGSKYEMMKQHTEPQDSGNKHIVDDLEMLAMMNSPQEEQD